MNDFDQPGFINYMERTRRYYRAQGFKKDYTWAQNDDVPFHKLGKPLDECRVTIVSTAVTHPDVPKLARKAESISIEQAPDRFVTDELAWDKEVTHTDDRRSYFPLEDLESLAAEGIIGSVSDRYHFVPTLHSQRSTIDEDAPAIRDACIEDEVDIAILVPL